MCLTAPNTHKILEEYLVKSFEHFSFKYFYYYRYLVNTQSLLGTASINGSSISIPSKILQEYNIILINDNFTVVWIVKSTFKEWDSTIRYFFKNYTGHSWQYPTLGSRHRHVVPYQRQREITTKAGHCVCATYTEYTCIIIAILFPPSYTLHIIYSSHTSPLCNS